jgi:cell division protein FtsW
MSIVQKKTDYIFLAYTGLLLVFGLIMLMSASSAIGEARFGDSFFFIKRQLVYSLIGLVGFFVMANIPYIFWKKYMWVVYAGIITLLTLVFVPGLGITSKGAQRWIDLGIVSIQASEFVKLGLIMFIAGYASLLKERIQQFQEGFAPLLVFSLIPIALVVLQPDIGTVSIMFTILFGLLYVAGSRISHLVLLATAGIVALGIMIVIAPYRAARLTTFLHPELDPLGIGYHINQAVLAVGSGGIFGLGLGNSRQKFEYLPEVHGDSIFAIIAEEMGFITVTALVVLITLIAVRGLRIAKHAPDDFGRLMVSGVIIWFIAQSYLNIGAIIGLLPLTGAPLPFVSHGGTALITILAAFGVITNVSKQS